MTRNPNWTRDELILALDLYLSRNKLPLPPSDRDVIELSKLLNQLPIHPRTERGTNFRNPNGVSMKLGNFQRLDPDYTGKGLSRGGVLEEELWETYINQPYVLSQIANSIRSNYQTRLAEDTVDYEVEEEYSEGRIQSRVHQRIERNPKLVKRKKESVLRKMGSLKCEVCGFDFLKFYGELGEGYIECHHLVPLAELKVETTTKLSDLALVCANCHRMIHRGKPLLSIEELRSMIDNTNQ